MSHRDENEKLDNAFLEKASSELNALIKKPVKLGVAQGVEQLQAKVANWPRTFAGNCVMDNATLTFLSNGVAHFTSVVFTNQTHSGDHWWASFQFRDANNVVLGLEGWHEGPRMDDGNGGPPPHYNFNFDFNFDPAIWGTLGIVVPGWSC